jgi:hypothetical protein
MGHSKMTMKLDCETTRNPQTSAMHSVSQGDHYSLSRQMITERLKALSAKPSSPQ